MRPVFRLSVDSIMEPSSKIIPSKTYVFLLLMIFAIALSAIISISKSVGDQSLQQQKSLSPAFDLVSQEIIKPLYIAETIARASPLRRRMGEGPINQQRIFSKLKALSDEFGMDFFIASELTRTQYNSDGSTIPLTKKAVEWYFRAKQSPHNIVGVLGNRKDVSIYYDIKIHDEQGQFLGFIGVSRRLDSFLASFDNFKKQYNYDFVIIDHNDNVVLSSDHALVADGKRIVKLDQLPWYQAHSAEHKTGNSPDNLLVNVNGEDFLVAKANLQALNWKLYLISSLQSRQNETTEIFVFRTINIVLATFILFILGRIAVFYMQREFAHKYQKDPLTNLPNRANLAWRFNQILAHHPLCSAIIVDVDHFKQVNDTYGHAAGDLVLSEMAEILQSQLRGIDVVGRWGGEEFVILLPSTDTKIAKVIAERTRIAMSGHTFLSAENSLNVTASFGIAATVKHNKLDDLVALADNALYEAKRQGRNQVKVYEEDKSNPGTQNELKACQT